MQQTQSQVTISMAKLHAMHKASGAIAFGKQTTEQGLQTEVYQASPGKNTTRAIISPCPFGCADYLALAELLISLYFWIFITPFDKHIDIIYQHPDI